MVICLHVVEYKQGKEVLVFLHFCLGQNMAKLCYKLIAFLLKEDIVTKVSQYWVCLI